MVFDIQDPLIKAFRHPKIFKFLHLPIQSGDDSVLRDMQRFYTSVQFRQTVAAFRAQIPQLTLATDIIVGFPGENQAGFENTLTLLDEVQPDITNVSKFFARPLTTAAKITQNLVTPNEKKSRSTQTAQLVRQISARQNQRWVGWVGEVLVDERGKKVGSWVGRNFAYKPVAIQSAENLFGRNLKVKVTEASDTYLVGSITD
jgi:tRNA A37 methylthiotransferase MiaB